MYGDWKAKKQHLGTIAKNDPLVTNLIQRSVRQQQKSAGAGSRRTITGRKINSEFTDVQIEGSQVRAAKIYGKPNSTLSAVKHVQNLSRVGRKMESYLLQQKSVPVISRQQKQMQASGEQDLRQDSPDEPGLHLQVSFDARPMTGGNIYRDKRSPLKKVGILTPQDPAILRPRGQSQAGHRDFGCYIQPPRAARHVSKKRYYSSKVGGVKAYANNTMRSRKTITQRQSSGVERGASTNYTGDNKSMLNKGQSTKDFSRLMSATSNSNALAYSQYYMKTPHPVLALANRNPPLKHPPLPPSGVAAIDDHLNSISEEQQKA